MIKCHARDSLALQYHPPGLDSQLSIRWNPGSKPPKEKSETETRTAKENQQARADSTYLYQPQWGGEETMGHSQQVTARKIAHMQNTELGREEGQATCTSFFFTHNCITSWTRPPRLTLGTIFGTSQTYGIHGSTALWANDKLSMKTEDLQHKNTDTISEWYKLLYTTD